MAYKTGLINCCQGRKNRLMDNAVSDTGLVNMPAFGVMNKKRMIGTVPVLAVGKLAV
jgi:hypothetical protein